MESVEFLFLNRQKSYIKIQGLINIFLDKCNAKAGYITPPLQKKKSKKKKNHRSSSLAHFQTELSSITHSDSHVWSTSTKETRNEIMKAIQNA